MIEAFFLAPPPQIQFQPPHQYRVDGIYQLDAYTLVQWSYGDLQGEYATGNTLYHNHDLLVCTGGSLSLGEPPDLPSDQSYIANAPYAASFRFNTGIGAYGVPYPIALNLRKAENFTPMS